MLDFRFRLGWLLILGTVAVAPCQAQQKLSLQQAIEKGLLNNFNVQIEEQNVINAQENNTWGQAGRLPTVNLLNGQNNSVVQRKPANPFAVAGRNISDNITGQLDVQFTLFDGFSVRMTKRQLEQLEQLSYGNASFVIEGTTEAILLAYYQALVDKENLEILEKNLEYSKERYEFVRLRKQLGGAITFDVLQEQNNYLTDSANVLQQGIQYKNALRNLNLLMSDSIEATYELTDALQFGNENYQLDELKSRMASSNTNLRNQFINQEILRTTTRLQRADMSPSVFLNIGATGSLDRLNAQFRPLSGGTPETVTVGFLNGNSSQPVLNTRFLPEYSTQTGNSYGAYGNLTLRWTLFNGGQIKRAMEQAQIREKIGQLTTEQVKLSLQFDLVSTLDLYNLRRQLVSIAETKLRAAELNLQLANERYKNGALSAIDLRIVQENYRTAALEKSQAVFNALASQASLVRITGGFIRGR